MATYTNSKELETKILENNDSIVFNVHGNRFVYKVMSCFLSITGAEHNDTIFRVLDIKNKEEFCSWHYNYNYNPPCGGNNFFPECKDGDYAALTRVVIALFKKIEETEDMERVVTWDNLDEGDFLWWKRDGGILYKKVLAKCGKAYLLSASEHYKEDCEDSADSWLTLKEIKEQYKIGEPEARPVHLSKEEIEKRLGYKIEIVPDIDNPPF